jgi:hypothetical protein
MKSLAEKVFEINPNIESENELLGVGYDHMRKESGFKSARYYFCYHEDFPADFVNEYRDMQTATV